MSDAARGLELENLQIVARPRLHWEALDLGVLIARRWYGLLLASWLCTALPVFTLLWLVMPEHPLWAILLVWWLKPLYERVPLRIISTAIFGAVPELRQALAGAHRAILPGLFAILSYRRFSPNRSFEAPVWVLEGLAGAARRDRFAVLQARAGSGAFWLTVLGVHVEAFLALGLITGVYLFVPANVEIDWWGTLLSGSEGTNDWLVNLLTFAVMGAIAPIYVAGGFALYLNRRIELEAWDLELGFRRLAQRVAGTLALVVGLGAIAPAGFAQDAPSAPDWYGLDPPMEALSDSRLQSREAIYEVLAGEDFNEQITVKYPKLLHDWLQQDEAREESGQRLEVAEWIRTLAFVTEVLLWAGLLGLALWIIHKLRLLELVGSKARRQAEAPPEVLGFDVCPESLPDDVAGTAARLWAAGEQRRGLSLIYRGALAALIHRHGCELRGSDTEGDCLSKARSVLAAGAVDYFAQLTRMWQRAAYAHVIPSAESFDALCQQFSSVLEADAG